MHTEPFEAFAETISRRLWRSLVLPSIGYQLMAVMICSALLSSVALAADDGDDNPPDPPAIVAALPDEGQPPAPTTDKPTTDNTLAGDTTAGDTGKQTVADPVAAPAVTAPVSEQAADPVAGPVAEVTTTEQVAQQVEVPRPAEPSQVRELSVEPVLETRPLLPADRPAWVGAPNDTSERIHRLYVASFTANSSAEVEREEMLDEPMVAAVARYMDEVLFPGQGAAKLRVTSDFIRQNLLDKSTSYVAAMTTQSGTEYQKWVVLQVSPEQREYLAGQLRELKQRERMSMLGVGLAAVLGVIGLANLGFNRRRRRYPNAVAPITMAIMPGNGHNQMQHVAAGAGSPPVVVAQAPKKRSLFGKLLILMVCAGLVFGLMLPGFWLVKAQPIHVRHIEQHGHVFQVETRPLLEDVLSDHD